MKSLRQLAVRFLKKSRGANSGKPAVAQKTASASSSSKKDLDKLKAENTRLRAAVKTKDKAKSAAEKSNAIMQGFLSAISTPGWVGAGTARALLALHEDQPSLTLSLAYGLLDNPETKDEGILSLILIHAKRRLYNYVVDLLDRFPRDRVIGECFQAAALAYAHERPDALATLLRDFFKPAVWDAQAKLPDFHDTLKTAMLAIGIAERADLAGEILARAPDPGEFEMRVTSYGHVRARLIDWHRRQGRALSDLVRPGCTAIGLLSHRSAVQPSTNLGDYVQSIAMLGLVAAMLPRDTRVAEGRAEGAADFVNRVLADTKTKRPASTEGKSVDFVWIDRDTPTTTPPGGPIWVPVNGWFMHPSGEDRYNFPFADNIRPIFLGVHINRADMLSEKALDYFRRYGPVGTRDFYTAELLMANGVDAFFSGCPTLTLDNVFGRPPQSERKGRYLAAHRLTKPTADLPLQRLHLDPSVPLKSMQESIGQAWEYLDGYGHAAYVETSLLHCYLPCRAMGTDVTFTNANKDSDPRFEGLIGISEEERLAIKRRKTEKLGKVMDLIFSGASEDEIYTFWREMNAADVEVIRRRMQAKNVEPADAFNIPDTVDGARQTAFRAGQSCDLPTRDQDLVHIVFCYDENFEAAAKVTLRSLMANTKADLCLTLLTRGLATESIRDLSAAHPGATIVWLDVTHVSFENLNLLRHTTVSTMDRLFLPQLMDYADRAVYLDVDIVVLGDIAELYSIDLGTTAIAGRITVFPGWHSGYSLARLVEKQLTDQQIAHFRRHYTLREPLGYACFNAGVQVLDMAKLREKNFTKALMKIVDDYGINDQYAVNLFCGGSFTEIRPEWNHIPTQEWIDSPKLIHYTGYIKPWDREYSPKAELWRHYARPADGLRFAPAIRKEWFK